MEFEVNVNRDKRAVTAFITTEFGKRFMGIAKCNPKDEFDENKGILIAKKRAMIALKMYDIKNLRTYRSYHEGQVNHYVACEKRANRKIRELYDEIREVSKN